MKRKTKSPEAIRTTNLVVEAGQSNFDMRWAELKIEGKNIQSRSSHIAAIHNNYLHVHGGYDVDSGVLSDFHRINLNHATVDKYCWEELEAKCEGKPIRLKNHSAVVYEGKMVIFGGEIQSSICSNAIYTYGFESKKWETVANNMEIPRIESHVAIVKDSKMYIWGGYIPEKAEFMREIYSLDLEKMEWSLESNEAPAELQGRSNFDIVCHQDEFYIFGGTNGTHTLNDLWKYSLASKKWTNIEQKNIPEVI